MVERVEFAVGSDRVVGVIRAPSGPGPHPGVVVAGPMTSVKEQVTGVYAAAVARRGIMALAIDHRGYRESEGLPRHYEHALRPHLTRWARFRTWYDQQVRPPGETLEEPQDIQQRLLKFTELRANLLQVNKRLIAYRDAMHRLVYG